MQHQFAIAVAAVLGPGTGRKTCDVSLPPMALLETNGCKLLRTLNTQHPKVKLGACAAHLLKGHRHRSIAFVNLTDRPLRREDKQILKDGL